MDITMADGAAWANCVGEIVKAADAEWAAGHSPTWWIKNDGTRVTDLDLRLDAAIRIVLARHFPDVSVLTEESGLLTSANARGDTLAVVDPVDGTDSLIKGWSTWWISIGIVVGTTSTAGLIYQPSTRRTHDSASPARRECEGAVVGVSPGFLKSGESAELVHRTTSAGVTLISTPHAVEKVAAVLEGRCAATVYLPYGRSPAWHSWDLAGCIAIAAANGLLLTTLDGNSLSISAGHPTRTDAWICAADQEAWKLVRGCLG